MVVVVSAPRNKLFGRFRANQDLTGDD